MEGIINEIRQLFKRNGFEDCSSEIANGILNTTLSSHKIVRKAILLSIKKDYDLEKD